MGFEQSVLFFSVGPTTFFSVGPTTEGLVPQQQHRKCSTPLHKIAIFLLFQNQFFFQQGSTVESELSAVRHVLKVVS
jgi:hypothetical protein